MENSHKAPGFFVEWSEDTRTGKSLSTTVSVSHTHHDHDWAFTASGNKLVATCSSTTGVCPNPTVTATLKAPDMRYTGKPYGKASVDKDDWTTQDLPEISAISYEGRGSTEYPASETPPTEPGDYTASVVLQPAVAINKKLASRYSVELVDGPVTASADFSIVNEIPETGDENNIPLYLALALGSAVAVVALRRKRA